MVEISNNTAGIDAEGLNGIANTLVNIAVVRQPSNEVSVADFSNDGVFNFPVPGYPSILKDAGITRHRKVNVICFANQKLGR